jgi:hypothetical protein
MVAAALLAQVVMVSLSAVPASSTRIPARSAAAMAAQTTPMETAVAAVPAAMAYF